MKNLKFRVLLALSTLVLSSHPARAANYALEDLLYQAMQSYPSILAKQSMKEAAATDLTAAKLKFLPNPTASTQRNQVTYSGQPRTGQPATTIGISQPLFMGGGLVAGYNKADARLSAADFAVLETREEISKRLINAYAEWLRAYLKIRALEDNVKLHERFASMIDRRDRSGVATGADRDLGSARLHQARADLDTQLSAERTALVSISQLVGQPVTRADLAGRMPHYVSLPKRQEGIDRASANSPAIQRHKFEAEAAEAEAKEVRASALPQVSFQAQRQIGNAYVPGAQGYEMYGLVMSYSPGGGFSSVASTSAAFEKARAATIQVEASKRDLLERLNADYNEYETNLQKKENLQRSARLSSSISESYDRQYLVGRKSWLDLMNAVRERAQQMVALADAESNVLASSRRLLVSIDGTSSFDTKQQGVIGTDFTASRVAPDRSLVTAFPAKAPNSMGAMNASPSEASTSDDNQRAPSQATLLMAQSRAAPAAVEKTKPSSAPAKTAKSGRSVKDVQKSAAKAQGKSQQAKAGNAQRKSVKREGDSKSRQTAGSASKKPSTVAMSSKQKV